MGSVGIIRFRWCPFRRSSFPDRNASAFVMFGFILGDATVVEQGFLKGGRSELPKLGRVILPKQVIEGAISISELFVK